jgi:hypothetical protein
MRLVQEISTKAWDPRIWPPQASDEEVKLRVLAMGASMMNILLGKALSHTIEVARLLINPNPFTAMPTSFTFSARRWIHRLNCE